MSVAVNAPAAAGLKLTETVQLAPTASVVPQVVVFVKDVASAPVIVMPLLEMVMIEDPVFFNVATCAALVDPSTVLGKVNAAGVSVAVPTPFPLTANETDVVAPPPLPVTGKVTVPL